MKAYIAIGSNIKPEENVVRALRLLHERLRVTRVSTVYTSSAEGRPEQPPYYNCVAEIETVTLPQEIKHSVLRPIEAALGRVRTEDKYAARTIDLDLIAYGDLAITTDDLVLPDPQITERAFLAIPLYELAPDWISPTSGEPIATAAARLSARKLRALESYTTFIRRELAEQIR